MDNYQEKVITRREFIKKIAKGTAITGLALGAPLVFPGHAVASEKDSSQVSGKRNWFYDNILKISRNPDLTYAGTSSPKKLEDVFKTLEEYLRNPDLFDIHIKRNLEEQPEALLFDDKNDKMQIIPYSESGEWQPIGKLDSLYKLSDKIRGKLSSIVVEAPCPNNKEGWAYQSIGAIYMPYTKIFRGERGEKIFRGAGGIIYFEKEERDYNQVVIEVVDSPFIRERGGDGKDDRSDGPSGGDSPGGGVGGGAGSGGSGGK